jgi:sugar phosphate isomerase/epimerase
MYPCLHPELLRRGLDIPTIMRIAAGAGFPAMETGTRLLRALDGGLATVQRLQEETGVRIVHTGWSAGLRSSRADFEAALSDTGAEMAFAAQIGSRGGTLVLPFRREQNVPDPDAADVIDRIQLLAEMAAGHGLRLVLEFVGLHIPDAPPHTVHDLVGTLEVLGQVRQPNVGVLLDSYHWHLSSGTVAQIAAMPPDLPLFVHINDAPAGDVGTLTDAMRVLPGDGVIDLDGFLGAIAARGYDGPVSIELFSDEMRAMEPAESARRAHDATAAAITRATRRRAG